MQAKREGVRNKIRRSDVCIHDQSVIYAVDRIDTREFQNKKRYTSSFTRDTHIKVTAMHLSVTRDEIVGHIGFMVPCMYVYTVMGYHSIVYHTCSRYSAFLNVLPRAGGYFRRYVLVY